MGIFWRNAPQNTPRAYFIEVCLVLSRGVNREVIKQSFKLCGISQKGLVPMEHMNACLRGILGYQEGLEVVQQYDNAFEDESGDEFDSEYFRISILVFSDS